MPWSGRLALGVLWNRQRSLFFPSPTCHHQKIRVLGQGRKVAQRQEGLPRDLKADWEKMEQAGCPAEYLSLLSPTSVPKEAASGDPGPSSITFFAFSLIEGYISIVMDAETQKKYVTPDRGWATDPKPGPGRKEVERQTLKSPGPPASPGSPVTYC